MKRIISMILVFAFVFILSACNQQGTTDGATAGQDSDPIGGQISSDENGSSNPDSDKQPDNAEQPNGDNHPDSDSQPDSNDQPIHIPVAINPSPDKYTWYIKDYVGKNVASIGYTSLGGERRDTYGASSIELVLVTPNGSYIDINDEDTLKNYVITNQNLEPNTELKLVFSKDSNGEEYSSLVDSQNYEEIVLGVKRIGEATQATSAMTPINPSPDKYTCYISDYVGRNLANCGYVSLSGEFRDTYGSSSVKLALVTSDGSYVDVSDDTTLKSYVVTDQNLKPNTELKFVFSKDSDGNEFSNLVDRRNYEEIVLGVKRIGEPDQEMSAMTPINPSPDKYTCYVSDYVGRNLAYCGYVSLGGELRDAYVETTVKLIVVTEDGSYVDPEDTEGLRNYVVTAQNIAPNTEIKIEYMKKSDGTEYDSLVDVQSVEEIELYVKKLNG